MGRSATGTFVTRNSTYHLVKTQCYIILTLQPFPALEQTIAQLKCNTKQANLTGNTVKPLLSSHPQELAR